MSWNYRIIQHSNWMGLHEVHYDGDGNPLAYTERAITFVCDPDDGAGDIIRSLEMALNDARTLPTLTPADFPADRAGTSADNL